MIVDSVSKLTYTFEVHLQEDNTTRFIVTLYTDGAITNQLDTCVKQEADNVEIHCLNAGAIKVLTEQQRTKLVADWFNAKQQLDYWKAKEMSLRTSIVSEMYTKGKGTQRVDLPEGWQLIIERGEDYKLDNDEGKVDTALEHFTSTMAELLVKWKPDISKTVFDALPDEEKEHFSNCLEIKPSSPQVKLSPPKAAKG